MLRGPDVNDGFTMILAYARLFRTKPGIHGPIVFALFGSNARDPIHVGVKVSYLSGIVIILPRTLMDGFLGGGGITLWEWDRP